MNKRTRHIVRNLIAERIISSRVLKEQIDSKDYKELRDFIRAEVALIFFDFFKKRNMWI